MCSRARSSPICSGVWIAYLASPPRFGWVAFAPLSESTPPLAGNRITEGWLIPIWAFLILGATSRWWYYALRVGRRTTPTVEVQGPNAAANGHQPVRQ